MRNYIQFSILFSALVLAACSAEKSQETVPSEKTVAHATVVPNTELELEIEGMVCEMGCGGAIRKELKASKAVEGISFDFVEDRAENKAVVRFDNTKISPEKIVSLIEQLNENQFTVKSLGTHELAVTNYTKSEDLEAKNSEKAKVSMFANDFRMPNLLDLFSGFLK